MDTDHFRVCSFNIQKFGRKKMENEFVVDIILQVLQRYDLILIIEVQDKSQKAYHNLLEKLNDCSGRKYTSVISDRLGRKRYKEQYLFLFDEDLVEVVDSYHFDDGDEEEGTDMFAREPFVVRFSAPSLAIKDFVLVPIHTEPDDLDTEELETVDELKALFKVYEDIQSKLVTENILFLGDFNAEGSYVGNDDFDDIRLFTDERFRCLIGNDVDTTIGTSERAYDRFVVCGDQFTEAIVPDSAAPYRFDDEHNLTLDEARLVSDHCPIELSIKYDDDIPPEERAQLLKSHSEESDQQEILATSEEDTTIFTENTADLRVCSFRIKQLGKKKMENEFVVGILLQILQQYDLIAILDVRDSSGNAYHELLEKLNNSSGRNYKSIISNRLGRKRYKEQYLFLFVEGLVEVIDSYHFDDGDEQEGTDLFAREPFIVRFSAPSLAIKDFVLVPIHTELDDEDTEENETINELNALIQVYEDIQIKWANENVLFLGDFNADGSYVGADDFEKIRIFVDEKFHCLIENGVDTQVGASNRAYDRFFVCGDQFKNAIVPGSAAPFKFDEAYSLSMKDAKSVSTNYPIELRIKCDAIASEEQTSVEENP